VKLGKRAADLRGKPKIEIPILGFAYTSSIARSVRCYDFIRRGKVTDGARLNEACCET
jgi:hypothetical protein